MTETVGCYGQKCLSNSSNESKDLLNAVFAPRRDQAHYPINASPTFFL